MSITYTVTVYDNKTEWKNKAGQLHREDGPAIEYINGDKYWYLNGKGHRIDGPAVEYANGSREWYINGQPHRENGPAVEYANGTKAWYLNGKCHREDGPAIISYDGRKSWCLNGIQLLTEEQFNKQVKLLKPISCNGKIVEIDGKRYELKEI